MKNLTLLLFGTFLLSRPLGFTVHFSCSRLVCCKIKAVLSCYSIHVPYPYPHRARQHIDLRFFQHASKCDNMQVLCALSHTDTCHSNCYPLSDPCEHRFSWAAILVRSAFIALSRRPSLLATIALLETHTLVFWHYLHPYGPHVLSPFKFTQQPTSCLVDWWVKIFVG